LKNPDTQKDLGEKISRTRKNLSNFRIVFCTEKAEKKFIVAENIWALWKNTDALGILKIFILPDIFKDLINVEKKSFMPQNLGHSGKFLTLKNKFGQFENLCLIISGR